MIHDDVTFEGLVFEINQIICETDRNGRINQEIEKLYNYRGNYARVDKEYEELKVFATRLVGMIAHATKADEEKTLRNFQYQWGYHDLRELRGAIRKSVTETDSSSQCYSNSNQGVYKGVEKVCDAFEVIGEFHDCEGSESGIMIRFVGANGLETTQKVLHRELHTDPRAICGNLAAKGLKINPKLRDDFIAYISQLNSKNKIIILKNSGWNSLGGSTCYALPPNTIINNGEDVKAEFDWPGANPFDSQGTLEQWRAGVGSLSIGQQLPMFAISAAFAPTLLGPTEMDGCAFNFFAGSSSGKTTSIKAAASTWGKGDTGRGFVEGWDNTINAVEKLAARSNDNILIFDELSRAKSKEIGQISYMIAEGKGRGRMSKSLTLREKNTWSTIVLSTGETTLEALVNRDQYGEINAGMLVRFLDVYADPGKGFGVFNDTGGFNSARDLADAIKNEAIKHYGVAGPSFIKEIISHDLQKVAEEVKISVQDFVKKYAGDKSAQAQRAAASFGLVGAAGELAIKYSIVPWEVGSAHQAAAWAFNSYLQHRGDHGLQAIEEQQIIEHIHLQLQKYGDSKFEAIPKCDDRFVHERWGYRLENSSVFGAGDDDLKYAHEKHNDTIVFCISAPVFKEHFCNGKHIRTVAGVLNKNGFLDAVEEAAGGGKSETRFAARLSFEGSRDRYYQIKGSILGDRPTIIIPSNEAAVPEGWIEADCPF